MPVGDEFPRRLGHIEPRVARACAHSTPDDLLTNVCSVIQQEFGPSVGVSLIVWDPDEKGPVGSESTVPGQSPVTAAKQIRREGGVTSHIVEYREPVCVTSESDCAYGWNRMLRQEDIQSFIGVPLTDQGRCVGALYLLSAFPESLGHQVRELETVSPIIARSIVERDLLRATIVAPEDGPHVAEPVPSAWRALFLNPLVGAAIVRPPGIVVHWSPSMARLWGTRGPVPGRALHEVVHEEITERIFTHADSSAQDGIATVWGGRQIYTTCTLIETRPDADPRYLMLSFHASEEDVSAVGADRSTSIELGPLGSLSPRELEVFALFGQGHDLKSVAALLHRSPRTIERHRSNISVKLGLPTVREIALAASKSGIGPEAARSLRVRRDD